MRPSREDARPPRGETFLKVAEAFAERSTCLRGKVGAVIVKDKHIISHGYNGAPPGMPQCDEVGCEVPSCTCNQEPCNMFCPSQIGCQRTIHAEANAIAWAARWGVIVNGATMYSTHEPCRKCADLIVACGIQIVYFHKPYRLGAGQFLRDAGVDCRMMTQA